MLYRLQRWVGLKRRHWLRRVRATGPIRTAPDGPVIVSQIGSVFVDMYVLALKSMAHWSPPKRVVLLNDGTLTGGDRGVLRRIVPNIEIRAVGDVDVGRCPRGGTWERLLTCIDESVNDFVIQVDSDTVTPRKPEQVLSCIGGGVSFTMSGHVTPMAPADATRMMTLDETAEARRDEIVMGVRPHIQIAAETTMVSIPELDGTRYVRGCSGFAGFAPGAISRADVERYSTLMHSALGQRWGEWGTEQVTNNYIIANAKRSLVLSWPEYVGIMPHLDESIARTIHFTGDDRFSWGVYERAAVRAQNSWS
jgi:hypothetical protein